MSRLEITTLFHASEEAFLKPSCKIMVNLQDGSSQRVRCDVQYSAYSELTEISVSA